MHKKVSESISTKCEVQRRRMAVMSARHDFSVGDFVLVGVDPQTKIPKLMSRCQWVGIVVQHLVVKILSEIHCSHLQFYCNEKVKVDIHLLWTISNTMNGNFTWTISWTSTWRKAIWASNQMAGSRRRNLGTTWKHLYWFRFCLENQISVYESSVTLNA